MFPFAILSMAVALRSLRAEPADVSEVRNQLSQLNKQLNAALSVEDAEKKALSEANERVAHAEAQLQAEKLKYGDLQQKLQDVKKKDGVEKMKAEVSADEKEEKELAEANGKLQKQLAEAQGKEKTLEQEKVQLTTEDNESAGKLKDLLGKMQSAISTAEGGLKGAATKALVQLDPSPVTDKTPTGGVPEQGFEGEAVEHKDMETVTGDWGKEYGGKKKVKSGVMAAAMGALVLLLA